MKINFECKKCRRKFDCDVGKVSISEESMYPVFEKDIICPKLDGEDPFVHAKEHPWDA